MNIKPAVEAILASLVHIGRISKKEALEAHSWLATESSKGLGEMPPFELMLHDADDQSPKEQGGGNHGLSNEL